ncbi:hypothetical protein [Pseudomonas sp. SDO52101_S400]
MNNLTTVDFEDQASKDFAPGEQFTSNGTSFHLLSGSAAPMSIIESNGTHVKGKVLVMRRGILDINLGQAQDSLSFWYVNADKGMTVRFFAQDGSKIYEFDEPPHGAGEKACGRTIKPSFTRVQIEVPGDNVLIDELQLTQ